MLVWQLILLQVITFVILAVVLHQFLYRQVTASLARLQKLYQENLEREEELKQRHEEAEREFQAKLARHNEELERLRAEAEEDARKMQEELIAQAKDEGRKLLAETEAKREQMKAGLVAEMEETAVALASDIIGRVLTPTIVQEIHQNLIDELIEEIGKSDRPRPELEADTLEVVVPFALAPAQHERLEAILSSTMGRSVTIEETIDESILAGLVIRLENVVLDGSLKTKLNGMLAYVQERLAR